MANISNTDDVIDSRDVIERIEELESERTGFEDELDEAKENEQEANNTLTEYEAGEDAAEDEILRLTEEFNKAEEAVSDARMALEEWDDENGNELAALKNLAEEGANESSDWTHGEALISASYFTDYTQQLAEDLGSVGENSQWIVIDWDATAENLKADYSEIDFDGETYYIRNS